MSKFENDHSQRSGNTLVCDYSVNDLNQLLIQSNEQHEETEHNSLNTSPGKVSTGDKYNQLTKLDDIAMLDKASFKCIGFTYL